MIACSLCRVVTLLRTSLSAYLYVLAIGLLQAKGHVHAPYAKSLHGFGQSLPYRALRLRGAGTTEGAELYSWNGILIQAVREHGDVVRVLDLQSNGAIMWESGIHSTGTLNQILSKALRTERIPAFLKDKVAPYIVNSMPGPTQSAGVEAQEAQPPGDSVERCKAPCKLPEGKAAAGFLHGSLDEAPRGLADQLPSLSADEQIKVDSFVEELVPHEMKIKLEALLAQVTTTQDNLGGCTRPLLAHSCCLSLVPPAAYVGGGKPVAVGVRAAESRSTRCTCVASHEHTVHRQQSTDAHVVTNIPAHSY